MRDFDKNDLKLTRNLLIRSVNTASYDYFISLSNFHVSGGSKGYYKKGFFYYFGFIGVVFTYLIYMYFLASLYFFDPKSLKVALYQFAVISFIFFVFKSILEFSKIKISGVTEAINSLEDMGVSFPVDKSKLNIRPSFSKELIVRDYSFMFGLFLPNLNDYLERSSLNKYDYLHSVEFINMVSDYIQSKDKGNKRLSLASAVSLILDDRWADK